MSLYNLTPDEVDFYISRCEAQNNRDYPRCWGISSDALVAFALGIRPEPGEWDYPRDGADLAACYASYNMAPEHVQRRMGPVLEKYRAHVSQRYPVAEVPS